MDALTETLLVFAARRDHIARVIAPALARGDVVLCDRFTDATFAYQGAGRGSDLALLAQLEAWVQEGLQPDLTLWFDLEPAVAAQRRAAARARRPLRGRGRRLLRARARRLPGAACAQAPERFVRIDADRLERDAGRGSAIAQARAR